MLACDALKSSFPESLMPSAFWRRRMRQLPRPNPCLQPSPKSSS